MGLGIRHELVERNLEQVSGCIFAPEVALLPAAARSSSSPSPIVARCLLSPSVIETGSSRFGPFMTVARLWRAFRHGRQYSEAIAPAVKEAPATPFSSPCSVPGAGPGLLSCPAAVRLFQMELADLWRRRYRASFSVRPSKAYPKRPSYKFSKPGNLSRIAGRDPAGRLIPSAV